MSTALDIIMAAYARSSKNQGDRLAVQQGETLDALNRILRAAYAAAARVNPEFFGARLVVPFAAGAWLRPANAEALLMVRGLPATTPNTLDGREVAVVPYDDPAAEPGEPSIYEFGQQFFPAAGVLDPTGGDLEFWVSAQAPTLATINDALPAQWPTAFDGLLVNELAYWLASKDGRADELPVVQQDVVRWQGLYVAHLEHATSNETRRFSRRREFNVKAIYPALASA